MSQSATIQFAKRKTTDYLVIHCSATHASQDIGAAEIDTWHRQIGWLCIGYHFVIRRDGKIEKGRPAEAVGAHVRDYNHSSIGICLVGGSRTMRTTIRSEAHMIEAEDNNFTLAQWSALESLLRSLKREYPSTTIQGHRDFPNVLKYCPSFNVKLWVAEKGI